MLEDNTPEEIQALIYSFLKGRELFLTSEVSKRSQRISRAQLLEQSYSLIQKLSKTPLDGTKLANYLINLHSAFDEASKFEKMFRIFKIQFRDFSSANLLNLKKEIIDISLQTIKDKMQGDSVEFDQETQKLIKQLDEDEHLSNDTHSDLYNTVYKKMEKQMNQHNEFLKKELATWESRALEIAPPVNKMSPIIPG